MTRLSNGIGWLLVVAIISLIYWQPSSSIRNGRRSQIYDEPYTVGLLMDSTICGGAILASTFVVTAASCVQNKKHEDITVHYGSTDRTTGGHNTSVKIIYTHGNFSSETMQFNIALLKTDEMMLDNLTSKAVELPLMQSEPTVGTWVLVSGWGGMTAEAYSDGLKDAFFNVKSPDECSKSTKTQRPTIFEEFCANTNVSLQMGDEGDPAIHNARLVGLGSYPPPKPDYPSVFTRVGASMEWIKSIIERNGEN
uniref:Group 3 allergen SMIPP-S Yv5018H10 n=1 Tax=Sarcoptes scabiei TaxID=52283 RepID=Q6VPU1_SARSC|nr:group 3 allergen SMIPP-S Yv5018H10 [Sarcoptes scabiei]